MPFRPAKPCSICFRLNCDKHNRRATADKQRGNSNERGYDYRWRMFSEGYRQRNPLCIDPYSRHPGQVVPSSQTDHIVSLERGGEKYDESNLQPLCDACHSYKTSLEDGGFGIGR
jgi:5-methylcytosine-specific restriction enzyme A